MVSGGHIRRTNGGRARPDKMPLVDNFKLGESIDSKLEIN